MTHLLMETHFSLSRKKDFQRLSVLERFQLGGARKVKKKMKVCVEWKRHELQLSFFGIRKQNRSYPKN